MTKVWDLVAWRVGKGKKYHQTHKYIMGTTFCGLLKRDDKDSTGMNLF